MGTTAAWALLNAMIDKLTNELPDVEVCDGPLMSEKTGVFVVVGAEQMTGGGNAVDGTQTPGPFASTRPRDEQGEVISVIAAVSGDQDYRTARAIVADVNARIETIARTDPTWGGVTGLLWTGYGSSIRIDQQPSGAGAVVTMLFRVSYRARI